MNDAVLTVMMCAWTNVKYLPITLVIPITYIGHFLHLKWLMIVDIEKNALFFLK